MRNADRYCFYKKSNLNKASIVGQQHPQTAGTFYIDVQFYLRCSGACQQKFICLSTERKLHKIATPRQCQVRSQEPVNNSCQHDIEN